MHMRLPFIRTLSRVALSGLVDHYDVIAKGMQAIEEAFRGYAHAGQSRGVQALFAEVDRLEAEADKIKRRIRNHLPVALLLAVDKTLFLNYTRGQDDILDFAQDAAVWLNVRPIEIPSPFREGIAGMAGAASATVAGLRPALTATVDFVMGGGAGGRREVKERIHAVRDLHMAASRQRRRVMAEIYNADMDFRDIHQLLSFVECLAAMSHSAEGCADTLRAMIAR